MGFSLGTGISALTVFAQGMLSFFSPCVLPLLPLYLGYLSGGAQTRKEDGTVSYRKGKVLLHTVFFVLGISMTFFLLGAGMSAFGTFLKDNQVLFARAGGIVVIGFGLYQLGIFGKSKVLGREHRFSRSWGSGVMSPPAAFVMGFLFSFAWTPCVGPALTSVLVMTASADTWAYGMVLTGVYTLGFVLPFLAVGLFTASLLDFFKKHGQVVRFTVRAGAVLMMVMGVLMLTGKMNPSSGSGVSDNVQTAEKTTENENAGDQKEEKKETAAPGFELTDQYGKTHTLEEYKGKIVFLNFWATWCGPCRAEMPEIQKLHEEMQADGESQVVVLGVAAPDLGREGSREEISEFLEENQYTYPVLFDTDGSLFYQYGVNAFPTTFMIDTEGNVYGYVSGQLSREMMDQMIRQTKENIRE